MIGRGGQGCVYRATQVALGREAAVRVLAPHLAADDAFVARFKREAQIANGLRHPAIVELYHFIDQAEPRRVAYAMALVAGPSLKRLLVEQGRLPLAQAAGICLQVARALAAVHAEGVVHRDIKPDNVLLARPFDPGDRAPPVCIVDFGIAKVASSATGPTTSGGMLGTPAYMAPEQIMGGHVGAAADTYALAEVLYELVSGRRAFPGDRPAVISRKLGDAGPELWLPEDVPDRRALRLLLSECLARDPDARPSLDALARKLALLGVEAPRRRASPAAVVLAGGALIGAFAAASIERRVTGRAAGGAVFQADAGIGGQ